MSQATTCVYAAYRPPGDSFVATDIHTLLASTKPTIIAGDLNSKHPAWNCGSTNTAGRRLFADAEAHGYDVSGPEVPTHYPDNINHTPDVLDIVVHRGLNCQIAQEVLDDELRSDHQPVLVCLSDHATRVAHSAPRQHTDWDIFKQRMETTTPTRPVSNVTEVNELALGLTACMQSALEAASSTSSAPQGRYHKLPAHIATMIADKRRLRKRWQQTRCPTMKNQLNRLTDKEVQALTAKGWDDLIDSADSDWTSVHRLCRRLKNTPAPVRPLLNSDGALRYTAADRAEIFAAHLERQFSPNPTDAHDHVATVEQHLGEYFKTPVAPDEDPIFVTPGQVLRVIPR